MGCDKIVIDMHVGFSGKNYVLTNGMRYIYMCVCVCVCVWALAKGSFPLVLVTVLATDSATDSTFCFAMNSAEQWLATEN